MAEFGHGGEWARVLDSIPLVIFVVDADVRILDANAAALRLLERSKGEALYRRGGEALHCIHSTESPEGCGRAAACRECVIRNAVTACLAGGEVSRRRTKAQLHAGEETKSLDLLVTASVLDAEQGLVVLVLEDVSELTSLKEIIPICSHCRRVREDQEYWRSVESYFRAHVGLDFSHGICPECVERYYSDLFGGTASGPSTPPA